MTHDVGMTPPPELTQARSSDAPAATGQPAVELVTSETMRQLLKRYPLGFVVSSQGYVFEVVGASSSIASVGSAHPFAPQGGGYFVTKPTVWKLPPG